MLLPITVVRNWFDFFCKMCKNFCRSKILQICQNGIRDIILQVCSGALHCDDYCLTSLTDLRLPLGNLVWRILKGSNYFRTPFNWGGSPEVINSQSIEDALHDRYILQKIHVGKFDNLLRGFVSTFHCVPRFRSWCGVQEWKKNIMQMTNQLFWVSCQVTIITLPATTCLTSANESSTEALFPEV